MRRPAALLIACALSGCRQDMHDQPRFEPFEKTSFFLDSRSARPLVPGTVARGALHADEHLYQGKVDGKPATTFPFAITRAVLERGHERYDIFCSPCHDRIGNGDGMIVERGFKRPPSFHIDRLRDAAPGYFFDVISNGFGAMFDYSDRVAAEDRWAIIAYIRALQLSQNAKLADLSAADREQLMRAN
ncbi:MAG: cytochrome c [Planctomycetota bacterium]